MVKINKGFTLIEILIAIAIFSLLGLASYQVLHSVILSDEISTSASERIKRMQRTYQIIQTDMMQMSLRMVRRGEGSAIQQMLMAGNNVIDSEDQGIAFVRSGWRNPAQMFPRGTLQPVGYRLVENRLERLHYLYPDQQANTEPQVTVLLEGVEELKFEYFEKNKWQTRWTGAHLPQGVAILLNLKDYGELRWQFLVVGSAKRDR